VNDAVLDAIRTRRVARAMTDAPVDRGLLEAVLDSARYAPHAGNRRLHRYVVVTRPDLLRAVRMMSPGMLLRPTAAIIVCIDWNRVRGYGFRPTNTGPYVDVGTATATLLLAAHAVGLAAGPVTSLSRIGVATILGLAEGVRPEAIVCLGHPAPSQPSPMRRRNGPVWDDLVQWERG
jgi:nitroreductase